jgi:SecD/SecF fusion protein
VATAGAPVDVAPAERKRRRDRLTTPADPSRGVSRQEFHEMVRDLGVDEEQRQPATAGSRGGRRARSRDAGNSGGPRPQDGGDLQGSGGSRDEPKKPRNRRHGRPR